MLIIVAPGQGSQTPGMLAPWLELPHFGDRLDWLSTVADMDLRAHGTTSDADTIRDTAIAQPLIVATGVVTLLELFPHPSDGWAVLGAGAGHSVGEITAAASTGVLTAEQAMVFVRERARAMASAAAVSRTSMAAVLGGDRDDVLASIAKHGLTAANDNGAGQIVAAGTVEQLAAFEADPPAKAKVRPLSVAGAFHTSHMSPATKQLGKLARAISTHDPRVALLSNADGQVLSSGQEVLRRLVSQVSNPVRWDLCMQAFADLEIPPAGTLTGLIKRALPGIATFALKSPDDLDAARAFVAEHGESNLLQTQPAWRLVVSPAKGTVRVLEGLDEGVLLDPQTVVAVVVHQNDETPVFAEYGGAVVEWLVSDGDPVSPGQPLLRLHPIAEDLNA
jgi:[acyl-carrier-protein] S-malonyltransferase